MYVFIPCVFQNNVPKIPTPSLKHEDPFFICVEGMMIVYIAKTDVISY